MINYDPIATIEDGSCNAQQTYLDSQIEIAISNILFYYQDSIVNTTLNYQGEINSLLNQIDDMQYQLQEALSNQEDGITQVDIDLLSQQIDSGNIIISDLNTSLNIALNDINDLQGQLQEALLNQEDGITQVDIDILSQQIDSANIIISDLNSSLNIALNDINDLQGQLQEALLNQEDGITQVDIDILSQQIDSANIIISDLNSSLVITLNDLNSANFLIQELQNYVTQLENSQLFTIYIDIYTGWNIFGYVCQQPDDVIEALTDYLDFIVIVKDQDGLAYLPEWNFNGIGDLEPGYGYQIKVTESIENFNLCE
jgi:hypothetical protein